MTLVKDIYNYINSIAPYNEMEEWDNSGFILGDEEKTVSTVVMALDGTKAAADYAKSVEADLLLTHSRDYKSWLKEKAEKCKQTYPEHKGVIYLSPEDMKYASDLADFEVKSRDSIELGGMLMVYEDMGIALDYTFDSAFEGQRSAFTEKAELVLG